MTKPTNPTTTDTEKAELIADAGFVEKPMHHVSRPKLVRAIAVALAKEREATWEKAIQIVKYADVENHWPLREGTLVKALAAARNEGNKDES